MASLSFNPLTAFCYDWNKIDATYNLFEDFIESTPKCPECDEIGEFNLSLVQAYVKIHSDHAVNLDLV